MKTILSARIRGGDLAYIEVRPTTSYGEIPADDAFRFEWRGNGLHAISSIADLRHLGNDMSSEELGGVPGSADTLARILCRLMALGPLVDDPTLYRGAIGEDDVAALKSPALRGTHLSFTAERPVRDDEPFDGFVDVEVDLNTLEAIVSEWSATPHTSESPQDAQPNKRVGPDGPSSVGSDDDKNPKNKTP